MKHADDPCSANSFAPGQSLKSLLFPLNAKNLVVFLNILSIFPLLFFEYFQRRLIDTPPALFTRADRFGDWINTLSSSSYGNPYYPEGSVAIPCYGPFTYLVLKPLVFASNKIHSLFGVKYHISVNIVGATSWFFISILAILSTALLCHLASRSVDSGFPGNPTVPTGKALGLFSLQFAFCSYPIVFAFDRGNIELITLFLVSCYVCSYHPILFLNNRAQRVLGVLALSFATAIKPYLLLYVVFNRSTLRSRFSLKSFLRETSFVAFNVVSICLFVTLISFAWLSDHGIPEIIEQFAAAQQTFFQAYTLKGAGDVFYISPFILFKKLCVSLIANNSIAALGSIYTVYFSISLFACILLLVSSRAFALPPVWLRFILLVNIGIFLLAFPAGSNEYKAVYLIIPLLISPPSMVVPLDISSKSLTYLRAVYLLALFTCINRYAFMGSSSLASLVSSAVIAAYVLFSTFLGLSIMKRVSRTVI